MPKGTIRRLIRRLITDRGYGFITTEQRKDLFFHRSELQGVEFASLREGQEVEFEIGRAADGRPQAVRVRLAQPKGEDRTPPTTAPPNLSGKLGNNGWYTSNVTVTLTASDDPGGTGVKEIHYAINGGAETIVPGASASFVLSSEGSNNVTYFAIDNAGNTETPKTLTVKIDKTPPSISGAPTTPPNANGWYKNNVTVHFNARDDVSGIASVTPDIVLSTEGRDESVTGTTIDMAGNFASTTVSSIKIDKTPPTISLTGVVEGQTVYQPGTVTPVFSAIDNLDPALKVTATLNGLSFTSNMTIKDAGTYTTP